MKGLLIKDLKLFKTRGIFLLFIIVGYTAFQMVGGNSGMCVGFATLMVGVFSLTTINYDEYDNGMPFIFTLPIQRREYVREKYLFGFLVTTVTWILMSMVCFCFAVFVRKETGETLLEETTFAVGYLITIYVLLSLQIALRLKYSERSGVVMIGIGAIMGVFLAVFYIEYSELNLDMGKIVLNAAAAMLILIFGFYKWAVRTMEKREF